MKNNKIISIKSPNLAIKKIKLKKNLAIKKIKLKKNSPSTVLNKKLDIDIDIDIEKQNIIKNVVSDKKKIDIVITYVDSTNPEWQNLFKEYTQKSINNNSSQSITMNRFRNNDELKYCLRSIDKYINFYRNIYIVMNHSPPSWLNIEHPQIKIVKHEEIPGLNENLPTFNSQAIECNLHKINNLTDEFLYFNDDVFINVHLEKLFFKDSKINIFSTNTQTPKGKPNKKFNGFSNAWINSNRLLDKNYKLHNRKYIEHCPHYVNKKVAYELEKKFKKDYDNTTKSKFRQLNNINPLCSILQYHYYYKNIGRFVKKKCSYTVFITNSFNNSMIRLRLLENHNPKIFCIEDNILNDKQENISLIKNFLNKKFPEKSQFEK